MKYLILLAVMGAASSAAVLYHYRGDDYHTKSWYLVNPDAMAVKLAWCRDNPGVVPLSPDCINADEARSEKSMSDFIARANALPWSGGAR